MSSSAITTQVAQLKIGNVQNQADSTSVYSNGIWSFKNSTALTSVTITDAGNVGVGVTPSAWGASNSGHLQLQDGVTYGRYGYTRNAYFDGASWRYIGTGLASQYLQATGMHQWFTAPSGTAGNAITYTESMRIDANGNLLIARTSASITTGTGVVIDGGTAAGSMTALLNDSGPANTYHVFNTTAGVYRFYVSRAGQINATSTSIAGISDVSLKENVRDLETGLSQVLALKPRRFDWKEETQIDQKDVAGFIAQEVEEVLPELVYEYKYNETETKKSLKMGDMLPTLVKAIQELSAKVDAQAAEIEALKAK